MHNQRGIVWIPILIMVVAVAAFSAMAYFVWQKNIRSTQTEDLTKPPVEHVAKNVNANDVANINGNTNATTSGWKVYTNTKHGYSVQYRQEWTVQERTASYGTNEGDSTAFLLPIVPANPSESNVLSEFVVQVFNRQGSETVDQAFARVRTFSEATVAGIQKAAVKLGGLDATKYTGVPAFATEDDIVVVKDSQIFVLVVNSLSGDNYSSVTESFTFDETLGWKTYSNATYGYSIRYPQTWSVLEEANARSTQLLPSGVTGTLSGENALNGAITLKYQPTADETNTVINRKDITINSVVAEQGSNPGITGFTATLIPKVDPALKVYWATKYTNAEYNTILSTLTFDETLGWRTYSNTTWGFSFKYPADWSIVQDALTTTRPSYTGPNDKLVVRETGSTSLPSMTLWVDVDGFGPFFPNHIWTIAKGASGFSVTKKTTEDPSPYRDSSVYSIEASEVSTVTQKRFLIFFDQNNQEKSEWDATVESVLSTFAFTQ